MIRYRRTKHGASLGRSRGQGIFDFFKPVVSLVNKAMEYKDVAKDVVNIGKNTRDIIKEIKTKNQPPNEIESIVNRINRIRLGGSAGSRCGSGFAYI